MSENAEKRLAQFFSVLVKGKEIIALFVAVSAFMYSHGQESAQVRMTIADLTGAVEGLTTVIDNDVAKQRDVAHAFRVFQEANPAINVPESLFDYFEDG